jgi:hypothetical protein
LHMKLEGGNANNWTYAMRARRVHEGGLVSPYLLCSSWM